ncbi:MAG: DUF3883 domain-containing protein [Desulfamplus sp.]|nr:DUF3883 domain-containing protein [Desulfamplus sp.]
MNSKKDQTGNTFLSRGIDYLGDLGAKLRDLRGYKTLAHELIQNADDVPDATSMVFDVRDEELIVDNDGVFSDCGQIEEMDCPWREDSNKKHKCDFHRFRVIASGDKRAEKGTTGAFGIGFISSYQITDKPELISANRHWILHEDRPEQERIEACCGCKKCNEQQLPGTRFIFPWAINKNSNLRSKLRVESITDENIEEFFIELKNSLSASMLFLKRLRSIKLKRNGKIYHEFQRLDDDQNNSLILSDGNIETDKIWHILTGDFSTEATQLKNQHPGRIESKRSSKVMLAIPEQNDCIGLFCAFLPTEQQIDLPFHINADFFPSNDRKRLNFTDSFEGEWNSAAIKAAAKILAQNIEQLPNLMGHIAFWKLLDSIKKVSQNNNAKPNLAEFWEQVSPNLQIAKIIFTTSGKWLTPEQCYFLLKSEESLAIKVLEKLGINIVNENLRPFQTLLRDKAVGAKPLNIPVLCDALSLKGFNAPYQENAWKSILPCKTDLKILWGEISLLRNQVPEKNKMRSEHDTRLKLIAIAPAKEFALFPCGSAYNADELTVSLFSLICPDIPFILEDKDFEPLLDICPLFDAKVAIDKLNSLEDKTIETAWTEEKLDLNSLLNWFEVRKEEILENPNLIQKFKTLTIFPSSGRLHKIDALALPGNFDDDIGLAEIVDLKILNGKRVVSFLRELGMKILDFKTYASRLPETLVEKNISIDKRKLAVSLLAKRIGEIRDETTIKKALAHIPLVECTDGSFQKPIECYFDKSIISDCLGISVFAKCHDSAHNELYEWLGVKSEPSITDIIKRVNEFSTHGYSKDSSVIEKIFSYLGTKFSNNEPPPELKYLCHINWLPAKGKVDRWYKPTELYAVFQEYLFESQATFLALPHKIQQESTDILKFFGVNIAPSTNLIVSHLLYCADNNLKVNKQVYNFLNNKSDEKEVLRLKGKKCLLIRNTFLSPNHIFWGEHPFGSYRIRLSDDLREFTNLFDKLGVREVPDYTDALSVMKEIESEFQKTRQALNDNQLEVILECWQILEKAIDNGQCNLSEIKNLRERHCIPSNNRMLYPPKWIFFKNRAGLSEKFGAYLVNNVISKYLGHRAMAEAGVRPISKAVEIELLKRENHIKEPEITKRIRSRLKSFMRILDAAIMPSEQIKEAITRLENTTFQSAESLEIKYKLHFMDKDYESEPEQTPALYLNSENSIIYLYIEGQMSWSAIARELSIVLLPDEDPGKIAAGIKEVLVADNADQASQTLDQLGYSIVDITHQSGSTCNEYTTTLGVEEPFYDFKNSDESNKIEKLFEPENKKTSNDPKILPNYHTSDINVSSNTVRALSENDSHENECTDNSLREVDIYDQIDDLYDFDVQKPEDEIEFPSNSKINNNIDSFKASITGILGHEQQGNNKKSDSSGDNSTEPLTKLNDTHVSIDKRNKSQHKLISYVHFDKEDEKDDEASNVENTKQKMLTEKSAVQFVMEYEKQHRSSLPEEMPSGNKGFDIKSVGPNNEIRYIEVKGIDGPWGDMGVSLSPAQFKFSRENPDKDFWLYVVEYAQNPSKSQLYTINSPAEKVNHFYFDYGWKSLATSSQQQSTQPVVGKYIRSNGQILGKIIAIDKYGSLDRVTIEDIDGKTKILVFKPSSMTVVENISR